MHMSKLIFARNAAGLVLAGLALGACSTSGGGGTSVAPAPVRAASSEGTVPDYCPQVSLREGTAILRRGAGDNLQYIASIASTTRSCRVKDGQLYMEIGVAGRVVPGLSAKPGTTQLPIRIAIVDAGKVAYSKLGQVSVSTDPAGGPQSFSYVDRAIRIPVPAGKTLVVFAGFDEGAPAGAKPAAQPRS
jgi:hypothetical protein